MSELIQTKMKDDQFWIILNRPEKLNALFGDMRARLLTTIKSAEDDNEIRFIVITGAGPGFCAGGDLDVLLELREKMEFEAFRELLQQGHRAVKAIISSSKAVLALVNGAAYGAGMNLAICCDFRVGYETASFSESFVRIGLLPDWGGSFTLRNIVGGHISDELIQTGRVIDSLEAFKIGIVNKVVDSRRTDEEFETFLDEIRLVPANRFRMLKKERNARLYNDLDSMLQYELDAQVRAFRSEECLRKLREFLRSREKTG